MRQNRQALRATPEQKRELGREIAAYRVRRGLRQDELGALVGRSQDWISRVERGSLVLSVFEYARLSRVLDIPRDVIERIATDAAG